MTNKERFICESTIEHIEMAFALSNSSFDISGSISYKSNTQPVNGRYPDANDHRAFTLYGISGNSRIKDVVWRSLNDDMTSPPASGSNPHAYFITYDSGEFKGNLTL